MGKLHVFEEIDERIPKRGEVYLSMGTLLPLLSTVDPDEDDYKRTILRRLTDEEVAKLVALQPADDERARFVRECAMQLFLNIESRAMAGGMTEGEWELRRDEFATTAIKDAEALAAKVF